MRTICGYLVSLTSVFPQDVTWCRARVVTARDKQGTERILHRTFEHNHTRKYPRNQTGVQRTELFLKDLMSLRS